MKRAAVVAVVAVVGGCDPFGGAVACDDDAACPGATPFCVDGTCSAVDDAGRDLCASDNDCGGGLCESGAGRCVPDSDVVDDCPAALDEPTRERGAQGPALFDLSLSANAPNTGGCEASFDVTFSYLDREGDMPLPSEFVTAVFVRTAAGAFASSGALVGSDVTGDDPQHRATVVYQDCLDALGTSAVAVWLEDKAEHRSNVVCAPPP